MFYCFIINRTKILLSCEVMFEGIMLDVLSLNVRNKIANMN